ncbi:alpha-ketoglutarate-dependent taurine dioxygenase [Streptomyces sp. 846.5]|nr:TauD/TfdA family dioxygenase [Streptomyces sp. 846.5]TDU04470.1 alpha-ketoglutarate-dependent taurine dioxygenase [Streptomyces sp. 846.5]
MQDAQGIVGVYEIDPVESQSFGLAVDSISANPYRDFELFYEQVTKARQDLPSGLLGALAELRRGDGPGALLVRGLPLTTTVPATPTGSFGPADEQPLGTERVLASVVTHLGEPFSYQEWDGGVLVHNKYPIRAHRDVQFGSNAVEFLVHTETPFRELSPDYLALLCLRGDPQHRAKTRVAPIARIVAELPAELRERLRQPLYAFETDNPVVEVGGRGLTQPHPLLTERTGRTVIEYVEDLVAVDAPGAEALAAIRSRIAECHTDVDLRAGDLLILDNLRVVHGRNAFQPSYDGTDRWLQRMLITTRRFTDGRASAGRLVADSRYANYPTAYQQVLKASV